MSEVRSSTVKLIGAFAAIYIIWGSTYLAIRYAIHTMPSLLMASTRFLLAGSALYLWSKWKGAPRGSVKGWRQAGTLGALLFLCGNGGVVLAERSVPSGLTAVLVATVPLWVALLEWLMPGGRRPSMPVAAGILLGLAGVTLLISRDSVRTAGTVDPIAASILIFSSIAWCVGSLYARGTKISESPWQASGMQMLCGGVLLLIASILTGEIRDFSPSRLSLQSVLALLYLTVLGSIVAFTAYSWLIKKTTPSKLSTYAYVNPAVAVVLGWAIGGEPLTSRMIFSMFVIVVAVILTTLPRSAAG